ncbi:elongation factor 4 [Candidatus Parcubacteria bacterium]|nr:MAG: elongation factor 4 [Candidatus Parcubacteria bacterium]
MDASDRNIRNFVIIAHIDSGKSTLADRLLEITGTVEPRSMKPQYLDQLELERERGITIKMAPVRMKFRHKDEAYFLNLIDTPGHSDFSYEVSRALEAVEGAILLVDATKGIQAQTLSNLRAAKRAGLVIVGAVNKIDLNLPNVERVVSSVAELLSVSLEAILRISAKTGQGVEELLRTAIEKIPSPRDRGGSEEISRGLIFDSLYHDHKGIIAFVRIFEGTFKTQDEVRLLATDRAFKVKEVGTFAPELNAGSALEAGSIGYIATGLKEPSQVKIGDTVARLEARSEKKEKKTLALPGYREPVPVVFISFYPDGRTEFEDLKDGIERLRLNDAALSFEPDANDALGRGLKVGFLGQLHFDITASRLKREFNLKFLTSFPSIAYRIIEGGAERIVKQPQDFPDKPDTVFQPMIKIEILAPTQYLNPVVNLKNVFELEIQEIKNMGENLLLTGQMPLAELIRDFDDQLKSISSGFASFSYELAGEARAEVEKLEILVAEEAVPALTRIVSAKDVEREGRTTVERLKNLLPRQQFAQAVQARARGRIIARETVPALRKDVTGYLYGGDRSRKMKLWKKQKRGKEKLKAMARVELSPEIFREILKK